MRFSRKQKLVGAAVIASLLCVYTIWPREPEHARAARQRARDLHLAEFDLAGFEGRVLAYDHDRMLVRSDTPESSRLLLRTEAGYVVEYDSADGSLRLAPFESWDAATGEISAEIQGFGHDQGWDHRQDTGRLVRGGVPASTRAKSHLAVVSSPSGDKLAIVTADGRFTPGSPGMIFGGTWARASGQHYVEVIKVGDGQRLIEPIAIPLRTSWRNGIYILWSADERFVVCHTSGTEYCVVQTGLVRTSRQNP
jgi:hypothetical protein